MIIPVLIKKLPHFPNYWPLPEYGSGGAACFDLQAILTDDVELQPEQAITFNTGLAFAIPDDHVMQVFSRSGHGFKYGVRLSNGTGIIDSDYRGEVKIQLFNDGDDPLLIQHGDKIAQAFVMPIYPAWFSEVDELPPTKRGEGGFGSTGR